MEGSITLPLVRLISVSLNCLACLRLSQAALFFNRSSDPTIMIGNAMTAMGGQAAKGHIQPNGSVEVEPTFDVKEVGDAIVYMAGLPLGTNILNMTIM